MVVGAKASNETSSESSNHPELELGRTFARSLASKDYPAIEELFHHTMTFRGLTPSMSRYVWEAHETHTMVTDILQQWFEETDKIDSLLAMDAYRVGDANHISYRFAISNPDGRYVIEQQAYYTVVDGRIRWMSVVCSGFRPI